MCVFFRHKSVLGVGPRADSLLVLFCFMLYFHAQQLKIFL